MSLVAWCLIVIAVSGSASVGLVAWALAGGSTPIRGLPRAPSYALTCLFGASWNALYVRSFWATVLCLALAGLFQVGQGMPRRRQTWMVVLVALALEGLCLWRTIPWRMT